MDVSREENQAIEAKVRELFDTSNRARFAEYLRDHEFDLGVMLLPTDQVRENWFRQAEKTWDHFRQRVELFPINEIEDEIEKLKLKEAPDSPKTLRDQMQEMGMIVRSPFEPQQASITDDGPPPKAEIRPLTQELINSAIEDTWPGKAAVTDFGITSERHLGALHHAIRYGEVADEELDAAMGNGEKLTEIARRGDNPYRNVTFHTVWDDMPEEPDEISSLFTPEPSAGDPDTEQAVPEIEKSWQQGPVSQDTGQDYDELLKEAIERAAGRTQDEEMER